MSYEPEKAIEAFTRAESGRALTVEQVGIVVALKHGRDKPYSLQGLRNIERTALAKIRKALLDAMGPSLPTKVGMCSAAKGVRDTRSHNERTSRAEYRRRVKKNAAHPRGEPARSQP